LAGAARLGPLHALSAAWLAHLDYVRNDMTSMLRHVTQALEIASADQHSARSRACLVVAEAYHFADRVETAGAWYSRSRVHATADGDEAHLSALMHNQAGLRGSLARLSVIFGGARAEQARHALIGAESTGHFDAGIGTASLASLVPMLRGQMLALSGHCDQALALFEAHFETAMGDGLERQRASFLADMAWCRWQLGQRETAARDADRALVSLASPCDLDDRACAQSRLAEVMQALGRSEQAAALREQAASDLRAHRGEQQRLAALLDDGLAGVDVARA
jgi:hypothetical protein